MRPKQALPVSRPDQMEIVRYYHAGGLSDALRFVESLATNQPEPESIRVQRPRDSFIAADDEF